MRGLRALVLLVLPLVLSACATRGSVGRVREEVKSLGFEIDELRRAQERTARDLGELADGVKASGERLAAMTAQAMDAAESVKKLAVRVEDAEVAVARLRAALETPPRSEAPPPEAAPVRPSAATPAPAPPRARLPEPAGRPATPERAYAAALAVFQSREYGQAVLDFLDFLARHPKHKLASNAQYWIGEAYYVQRDYRQAAVEFQKVIDDNPGGTKTPDALVKLGLCFAELRQPERAEELWRQVVRDYPESESADKARRLIRGRGASRRSR